MTNNIFYSFIFFVFNKRSILYHYLAEIKEGLGWPIFDLIKVYTCPDNGSRMHMLSGFQRSAEIAVFTLIGLNYESAK